MKILILIMNANKEPFISQTKCLKKCYDKLINKFNLSDEIDVYSYVGDSDEFYVDNNNEVHCISEDDLDHTYQKTIEVFEFFKDKYDYIVRTNNSQFINIHLMYEFIKTLQTDDVVYTGVFHSFMFHNKEFGTIILNTYDICLGGNFLILPNKIINILIENKTLVNHLRNKYNNYIGTTKNSDKQVIFTGWDDVVITTILTWVFRNNDNIYDYKNYMYSFLNHCKSFNQGYFRSFRSKSDFSRCFDYANHINDFVFLKQFITIRVKNNTLHKPIMSCTNKIKELCNMFMKNMDNDIHQSIKKLYESIKNPIITMAFNNYNCPNGYMYLNDYLMFLNDEIY